MTVHEALTQARIQLEHANRGGSPVSGTPLLDVSILLSRASGLSRTNLMAHPEISIDAWAENFFRLVSRRCTGEPIAYITGYKEFWRLNFAVTPDVLIPRADTEILVERALAIIGETSPLTSNVLDACTGSGCIAIALASSVPGSKFSAFDISAEALSVARKNARTLLGSDRNITFTEHDLRNGLPRCGTSADGKYSLIVSNPPYVPADTARTLLEDGRGEPLIALDGGRDGLDLVRILIDHASFSLIRGGSILIETGEYNAKDAGEYLKESGFTDIVIHPDLAGQDRVVEGKNP